MSPSDGSLSRGAHQQSDRRSESKTDSLERRQEPQTFERLRRLLLMLSHSIRVLRFGALAGNIDTEQPLRVPVQHKLLLFGGYVGILNHADAMTQVEERVVRAE